MNPTRNALIGFISIPLILLPSLGFSEEAFDGSWLMNSVYATQRIEASSSSSVNPEDTLKSLNLAIAMRTVLSIEKNTALMKGAILGALIEKKKFQCPKEVGKTITFLNGPSLMCVPDSITVNQGVAILKKYLDSHPEEWGTNAPMLIQEALAASFPCK